MTVLDISTALLDGELDQVLCIGAETYGLKPCRQNALEKEYFWA